MNILVEHCTASSLDVQDRGVPHICVCICTFKRPETLGRLLNQLKSQETGGRFTYSVVVADNDAGRSAEPVVSEFAASSSIAIRYCVEPAQSIPLARNKAIANSCGDYVAFIDDDEFPKSDWLLNALNTCQRFDVAGVLGPVQRHFDEQPPKWIVKSKFYCRPTHNTGYTMPWEECRTGNVLLRREVLQQEAGPFRAEFRAGEDQDLFRRMMEKGHRFIWCDEAPVFEVVPPSRWDRAVMLRRALLRGAMASLQPNCGFVGIMKSIVAVPAYTLALPFCLIAGQHWFMTVLVKMCDHLGKLLFLVGIDPVKEPYVSG
ncbi:MAG TPA: glycosyltransferase family A protein [Terriglobales bacterium]|nr:glycosyltransferase family A protein [Terriglobales bacterium]